MSYLSADLSRSCRALDSLLVIFATVETWPSTTRILRIGLYTWLLLSTLLLLPYHRHFWSNDAMILRGGFDAAAPGDWLFNLMSHPAVVDSYLVFLSCYIGFLLLGVVGWAPRLTALAGSA